MNFMIKTNKLTEMPVNDDDLEKKILKTILLNKKNTFNLDILIVDDFYNEGNKKVYKSFMELGSSLDYDLLPDNIRRAEEFKQVMFVDPLFNFELSVYIERLQKITRQRKLQCLASKTMVKVKEDKSSVEITNWLTNEFTKFTIKVHENIEKQNMRINTELLEELQRENYFGLPSGYSALDYRIRGFSNGTFTILGGNPSVGKTTWLLNVINHLCKRGKRVLHVNLEMSNVMLQMKMLSVITGISTSLLMMTKKNFTDANWKIITDALGVMANYKWFRIGESTITTTATIENTIKEQGGFDIVIVDYLQLMNPVVQKKSRYEDVSNISRELKKLSTKYNIPFVVVSSLKRHEERKDETPIISDLKESGNIEYDADLILFITRKVLFEKYDVTKHGIDKLAFEHFAELLIAKNRWGVANRKMNFYFDGERSLFREATKEGQR